MDLWNYRDEVGRVDVTGYDVEARDGRVGSVREATLARDSSYLVVDAGGTWTFGGKATLVPAGLVERIDRDDETVYVSRTREEIEAAPEFDDERYRESAYREKVGAYYVAGPAPVERR